jgi:CheY-like chemotaxis protein
MDGGEQALAALRDAGDDPFHLAIVDLMMPEMDGLELADHIRDRHEWNELRLFLLSSSRTLLDTRRVAGLDFARTLTKPVKQSDLLDAISDVFGTEEYTETVAPAPPVDGAADRALRVLLAEDNPVNQQVAVSCWSGAATGPGREQRPRGAGGAGIMNRSMSCSWTCRCPRWTASPPLAGCAAVNAARKDTCPSSP